MRKRKKYKIVYIDGKAYREHRLIVENSIERKLKRYESIHHIDGNGMNNDLANLEIINEREHVSLHQTGRIISEITKSRVQKSNRRTRPGAKITPEDVLVIRRMLKDKIKQWLIAWIFQISRGAICDIKCGRSWSWI